MIGKSPLWVSKQHGHGPETMFRAYTAWTESEIAVIKTAMGLADPSPPMNDSRDVSGTAQRATKIDTTDDLPRASA